MSNTQGRVAAKGAQPARPAMGVTRPGKATAIRVPSKSAPTGNKGQAKSGTAPHSHPSYNK